MPGRAGGGASHREGGGARLGDRLVYLRPQLRDRRPYQLEPAAAARRPLQGAAMRALRRPSARGAAGPVRVLTAQTMLGVWCAERGGI